MSRFNAGDRVKYTSFLAVRNGSEGTVVAKHLHNQYVVVFDDSNGYDALIHSANLSGGILIYSHFVSDCDLASIEECPATERSKKEDIICPNPTCRKPNDYGATSCWLCERIF